MVIYQPLVFPRLQRRFGNVRCYRGGTISMNVLLLVFPFYHFLWDKGWVLWAAIGVQRLWEVATATAMWMPSFIMVSTITCTHTTFFVGLFSDDQLFQTTAGARPFLARLRFFTPMPRCAADHEHRAAGVPRADAGAGGRHADGAHGRVADNRRRDMERHHRQAVADLAARRLR